MQRYSVAVLSLSLATLLLGSHAAVAQEKGLTGKWTGTGVNDMGLKSDAFLDLTVNDDGTLTGTWGCPGQTELKIEKGEQVTADVLRWESSTETHRWCVRATVKGKALVLDTTCTSREDGKVKGGTAIDVLVRN